MKIRLEKHDNDAWRLMDGERIAGFAIAMSDGTWGLYDADERRVNRTPYGTPRAVARALQDIMLRAIAGLLK